MPYFFKCQATGSPKNLVNIKIREAEVQFVNRHTNHSRAEPDMLKKQKYIG